jgi:AcrR family transcriptional regulator
MVMPKSFSEREKENIKKNLLEACKQSWTQYGYKKTSVDELCRQAGISKGAFYLFFESKEALFCDVLCSVQEQICEETGRIMEEQRDRYGAAKAIKMIYREYHKNNFLYNGDSRDFTVLMNRLEQQAKRLEQSNNRCRQLFENMSHLRLKVPKDMAISVIYSLIMNIRNKEVLPWNHMEIFDFMTDHLIESLYEEEHL